VGQQVAQDLPVPSNSGGPYQDRLAVLDRISARTVFEKAMYGSGVLRLNCSHKAFAGGLGLRRRIGIHAPGKYSDRCRSPRHAGRNTPGRNTPGRN